MLQYLEGISVDDYIRLRNEVGWKELPRQQAQIGLDNSSYIVSCNEHGKTVATARVLWDGGYVAYIADVMVSPSYQRRGIGRSLMQLIMDYLHSQVNEQLSIMTVLVAAKGKEEFYKKYGFEERPSEKLGPGMSQWIGPIDRK